MINMLRYELYKMLPMVGIIGGAFDSAKNHKLQRRKR